MPAPYDYTLNLPDPTQSMMQGVQSAMGISNMLTQKKMVDQQILDAEEARKARLQLQADLAKMSQNPTPSAVSSLMLRYPQLSENLKRGYDVLDAKQKETRVDEASRVYAALRAGKPDIAIEQLVDYAGAYRNSGMEKEAKVLEDHAELIRLNPKTAETSVGLFLAASMGPEKFTEAFTKLEAERRSSALEPSTLSEAQSKAHTAAVEAKFAESVAVTDLQKKGWDITKIQEDIKIAKENAKIAAANAAIAREGNAIKREENKLKLQEMILKRDELVRTKASDLESARTTMDNMLDTADRILATPFGIVGSAAGPVSSKMPTMSQDTADFEELVTTLGSQAFMAQIPAMRGLGSLTEAEGAKLQSSLQNLSLRQSPERLLENVRNAQRLILKARKNMAAKHGVPDTIPDTPNAFADEGEIGQLLRKYYGPGK
jgi:hypothetical protein